jgi:PIN like domain
MWRDLRGVVVAGLFDGFEGYRVVAGTDVNHALTSALVAVDANVLLNLYRYNARTTHDLLAIFEKLGDRLVVPHQAMREFHRNRLSAIGNPERATKDVREALNKSAASASSALTSWAKHVALEDAELQRLQAEVSKVFAELIDAVDAAEPDRVHAATPAIEDRVLSRLSTMLEGKVLPRPPDDVWAALIAEGQARVEVQQPPGYLDAGKGEQYPEGAAGDFLVYRQACEEAKNRGLDLVIITGDEKEDWWWRNRGVPIGPRQEMTKEFFDFSGGHWLFLLRPSDLLQRSEALDVEVSPGSLEDAGRTRSELDPIGAWTPDAVEELLVRLEQEGRQDLVSVIGEAARLGGTISRDAVYRLCGYDDERMLRGFTRPTSRITGDLQREGILPGPVTPMLVSLYRDDARLTSLRVPVEVVEIIRAASDRSDAELDTEAGETAVGVGKYGPLTDWLLAREEEGPIAMPFREVERIIGVPLAPSARMYLPYWYSTQNSLGKAIAAAGYKASGVNLTSERLVLVRR